MLSVVLPGRAYDVDQPLLRAARTVLAEHGHEVVAVRWPGTPEQSGDWVAARLVEALGALEGRAGERVLVVAKSLGTRATPYAAGRAWPAVWLTPLLRDEACVAGLRANPAPQLLVGGGADPLWDPAVARSLAADPGAAVEVHEVPGADHALEVEGRVVDVSQRLARFVEAVAA